MSNYATTSEERDDRFGSGLAGAIVLHLALIGGLAAVAVFEHVHAPNWGENTASVGAIQASMVSAIPLPPKAAPVKDSVLASEDVTPTPKPPPKEATQPPPKPTDVLIKAKTPAKVIPKVAPIETPVPPKHPQPAPVTPKAASGDAATQLPQSVSQLKNGTAALTVQNRVFGNRYAYYLRIVANAVNQSYATYSGQADPNASMNKSVTVLFDIQRDGSVANLHVETRSGSSTLDTAALRAIQHLDNFPQLPEGNSITIEYKFDYR
ncbi:TonB family protein [Granulicella mallensis]|uniref:TonB family protein n=1 Tax=Granulicella mallensis (strain ATCC BAA-1857 / DSM 23137 / MP5ACTX8) TaxID=682795 RepID=G8NZ30_GRAMM|nr:TonB family protein [Granulicella mallensis]AEU35682.1 TonB family protein [Granulicella mallensis MP5ACTX8]